MLEPYLIFDGNCADAMRFYERTLGGKLEALTTFGESPVRDQVPPGAADRVMHARLVIGDRALMASDGMLGEPYEGMKSFSVTLYYPEVAEAKRVFDALAEGGKVNMPMGKTFWAEAFGMLVDRFGTPWFVSGGAPTA
jgi:PhnB protein